jgi:hypothetical protein
MKARSVILIVLALVGGNAQAPSQALTGQGWLENWSSPMKATYMLGFSNGFQSAVAGAQVSVANAPPGQALQTLEFIETCRQRMTIGQLTAIVDKAVKDHPETWDQQIGNLTNRALLTACMTK